MSVVIKTVRVRGRISTEGDYWKNPAPNSLGMGDLVLTLEKKGVKDYEVFIRPIHVKKNSEGEYLQQPNTVYSTIGNPGSESFGGYPSIYGSSFDIEPKPSNDVYKTTDDFITKFISNRNLPANLKQNYGRPSSGDSFRSYYAGLTQAPPFYEIIQDPFVPTSVPVHTEGYFNIWNQWVLEINTPVFRSELPTSQIGGTPSQIGGTPSITGLSQSILLNVVFPSEFGVKVREDVPKFKIWVGDPQPEEQVDGFITEDFEQTDEEGNVVELSNEYIENEFAGGEDLHLPEEKLDIDKQVAEQIKKDPAGSAEVAPNPDGKASSVPTDTPGYGGVIGNGFNGVPYYCQGDARWGKLSYGDCNDKPTMTSSGCGPTSLAMVINFWAKKGFCSPTTPFDIGQISKNNGGRVCGVGTALTATGLVKQIKEKFGLVMIGSQSDTAIKEALKKGYPCIISGKAYGSKGNCYNVNGKGTSNTTAGHFVCLTGIDEQGRIRVNDPGYSSSKGVAAFEKNTQPVENMKSRNQSIIIYPEKKPIS